MQALIEFLTRNLLALWPVVRVSEWECGLLVRGGMIVRELGPGLHWRWLFLDEFKRWPSNEVPLDLATAAVTTTDGKAITVSANISYRITSIAALWRGLWSAESSIKTIAIGEIASFCANQEWASLQCNRRGSESALCDALNARVSQWGLVITRVHLTDLVLARVYRHYIDKPVP